MGFNSGFKGLMLYMEIIAVCSQIRTEHVNTLCGKVQISVVLKLALHIVTDEFRTVNCNI